MTHLRVFSFLFLLVGTALQAQPDPSRWRVVRNAFIEASPAVPEVHASTIAETADGTLVAAWFGGSMEGNDDVAIWVSRFDGKDWSAGQRIATGEQADGTRFATWNPVLHRDERNRLILFFKTGPSPEKWWGERIISDDGGVTWSERQKLPGGMLGPIKNKPVRLADGSLLCPSSVEEDATHWTAHMERVDSTLQHWEKTEAIADPNNFGAIQPTLLLHPDGRIQALARSRERELVQSWSADDGRTWSPLESTGLFMPNSGIDAVALRTGGFLLVYNPAREKGDGKTWGERRPLIVAYSADGKAWKTVATLETERSRFGYAYPAIIEGADGLIHITYTWTRTRLKHVTLARD